MLSVVPRGPVHRSIVVVDIAGSSRWDNPAQLRARAALTRMMRTAFRAAGVGWWRLSIQDRGDGLLVIVPPGVSKADLLDPFVPRLVAELRAYNAVVPPPWRIRLRLAVHAGELLRAWPRWVSEDVKLACRLVDGEPLYELLARSGTDLAVVVSERIHDGVVRHGYKGIDPDGYAPVRIRVKEVDAPAWLRVDADPASADRVRVPVSRAGEA
ncbi:hypothetical protein [Amycolatopsis sp. Hca4]|uniref:hypothetical protein n=1 Tax=Amycolatopsis sp. Hca4 TaxID=2742131 RepID=UPI0015923AB0|nr:hypothetical protein [Amycolatopsis sp. Hca4]QKV78948.1 hypothetical protein HUT10_38140 [Amycolatopsis sp. Hca4]